MDLNRHTPFALQSDDQILIFNHAMNTGHTVEQRAESQHNDPVTGLESSWVMVLNVPDWNTGWLKPFDVQTHEYAQMIKEGRL